MPCDLNTEYMTAFVVPIAGFSRRTEGVFIEPCLIFAGPSAVAFGDVAADRSSGAMKLVGYTHGSLVA